jgi:hypothetical protein
MGLIMKKLVYIIIIILCTIEFSIAQDANNPIDPKPTAGLFNRIYGNEFLRTQFIANATLGDWFVRLSSEVQFNYNSNNQFKGINFLVARLFSTDDGNHKFGTGGIISYIDPKGIAGGINVVSVSKLGEWKFITLTTYQAGKDISLLEFQPGIYHNLTDSWYLRSHPRWLFDFITKTYEVPIGLGIGNIIDANGTLINLFAEPQYDIQQSRMMLYFGVKVLF